MKRPPLKVAVTAISLAFGLLSPLQAESTDRQAFRDLMNASNEQISGLLKNTTRLDAPQVAELREKLDKAAHQRDAYASGLFWHTGSGGSQGRSRPDRQTNPLPAVVRKTG